MSGGDRGYAERYSNVGGQTVKTVMEDALGNLFQSLFHDGVLPCTAMEPFHYYMSPYLYARVRRTWSITCTTTGIAGTQYVLSNTSTHSVRTVYSNIPNRINLR